MTHPDAFSEGRQSGDETSPLCISTSGKSIRSYQSANKRKTVGFL